MPSAQRPSDAELAVLWHDAECGGYEADLELWRSLTAELDGPLAELGAGTGRISLALARRGAELIAIESEAALAAELERRAAAEGLGLRVMRADATGLELAPGSLGAVLAPMQFLHLLSPARRAACLGSAARWLRPGGRLAAALLAGNSEPPPAEPGAPAPLPDVREREGWVASSLPLDVRHEQGWLIVRRLRQLVAPDGELGESLDELRLWRLGAGELESEAARHGFRPLRRLPIPPHDAYADSVLVMLERR